MRQRSADGEANLAGRIEWERTARGWSYETLARAMTDAGCRMQASSIYKIEKGSPPRRITVDELLAFAAVFETTTDDLLTSLDLLRKQRAQEVVEQLDEAATAIVSAVSRWEDANLRLLRLAADDSELYEYAQNLRPDADSRIFARLFDYQATTVGEVDVQINHEPIKAALAGLSAAMRGFRDEATRAGEGA